MIEAPLAPFCSSRTVQLFKIQPIFYFVLSSMIMFLCSYVYFAKVYCLRENPPDTGARAALTVALEKFTSPFGALSPLFVK